MDYNGAPVRAKGYFYKEGLTYGKISSKGFTTRYCEEGFIFSSGGAMIFSQFNLLGLLGFTSSQVAQYYLNIFNPTLNNQVGDVLRLPISEDYDLDLIESVENCILYLIDSKLSLPIKSIS